MGQSERQRTKAEGERWHREGCAGAPPLKSDKGPLRIIMGTHCGGYSHLSQQSTTVSSELAAHPCCVTPTSEASTTVSFELAGHPPCVTTERSEYHCLI